MAETTVEGPRSKSSSCGQKKKLTTLRCKELEATHHPRKRIIEKILMGQGGEKERWVAERLWISLRDWPPLGNDFLVFQWGGRGNKNEITFLSVKLGKVHRKGVAEFRV